MKYNGNFPMLSNIYIHYEYTKHTRHFGRGLYVTYFDLMLLPDRIAQNHHRHHNVYGMNDMYNNHLEDASRRAIYPLYDELFRKSLRWIFIGWIAVFPNNVSPLWNTCATKLELCYYIRLKTVDLAFRWMVKHKSIDFIIWAASYVWEEECIVCAG